MFKKNFMIITKCGDDKGFMEELRGVIDMSIKRRHGRTMGRIVDKNNLSLRVFTIRTTDRVFNMIREIIEDEYPGYCMFKRV